MPLKLTRYPIAYYGTPKVACTSLKMAMYQFEFGKPWISYQDAAGKWWHIHNSWELDEPSRFVEIAGRNEFFKFAVIRSPLDRFLSAYSNRVLHHRELSKNHLL